MDSFAFYISALRKRFAIYCSEKLTEKGITYGQLFILIYIGKREFCSPKEISMALKLDAGHLNRTLTKLIENGFILQRKNEKDRRANIVTLTEKGNDIFTWSRGLFLDWDQEILASLSENEIQHLLHLLKKVTFSMTGIEKNKNDRRNKL